MTRGASPVRTETTRNAYSVAEAQAGLPRILRNADKSITVVERSRPVYGYSIGRERMEAITETMELLGDPEFSKTLARYRAGRLKFHPLSALDA